MKILYIVMNKDQVFLRSCIKEDEMMDLAKKERGFLNFFTGKAEVIIEIFKEHSEVITDTEECQFCFGFGFLNDHEDCDMCGNTGYIVYLDDVLKGTDWG